MGEENKDFNLPKDVPDELFDIVSQVLSFIEVVDENKNKTN